MTHYDKNMHKKTKQKMCLRKIENVSYLFSVFSMIVSRKRGSLGVYWQLKLLFSKNSTRNVTIRELGQNFWKTMPFV